MTSPLGPRPKLGDIGVKKFTKTPEPTQTNKVQIPKQAVPTKPGQQTQRVQRENVMRQDEKVTQQKSVIPNIPKNPPAPPPLPSSPQQLYKRAKPEKFVDAEGKPNAGGKAKQAKAIHALREAAMKTPAISVPLNRQLQMGADAIKLKYLAKEIEIAMDSKPENYELPSLDLTTQKPMNPVKKIGGVQFVPQTVVSSKLKPGTGLSLEGVKTYVNKDEALNQLRFKLSKFEIKEGKEVPKIIQNEMDKIYRAIKLVKEESGPFIDASIISKGGVSLKNLTSFISSTEFVAANHNSKEARELIQLSAKDAAINLAAKKNPRTGKLLKKLFTEMQQLNKANKKEEAQLKFEQMYELAKNSAREAGWEEPEFVFKTGLENEREILIGSKLSPSLGLSRPVASKSEVALPGTHLVVQKEGPTGKTTGVKYEDPEGIASRFLEGAKSFDSPKWEKYLEAKKNAAASAFQLDQMRSKTKDPAKLKPLEVENNKAQEDYNKSIKELMSTGKHEGIMTLGLLATIFGAYDDHPGQLMLTKEGNVVHIDLARFGAPSEVWCEEGFVFPALRICELDHPLARLPLPKEDIDAILSWDIANIEKTWKEAGICGDKDQFAKAEINLKTIPAEKAKVRSYPEALLNAACKKFHIKSEGLSKEQKMQALESFYDRSYEKIQKKCFPKLSPDAFAAIIKRMETLQKYAKHCKEKGIPFTLRGSFNAMYPNLAVFLKVLERLNVAPGDIGYRVDINEEDGTREIGFRSLNSIIDDAEYMDMATPQELSEMKKILLYYQAKAPKSSALKTTMAI